MSQLRPSQRQYLKGLAHGISPIVQIGAAGVTDGVRDAIARALEDHELIKVRIGKSIEDDRKVLGQDLAASLDAELCQVIGRVLVLFRSARNPDKRKIKLPKA
jgi:RNA-binding protein